MKRAAFLSPVIAAGALLIGSSAAMAAGLQLNAVTPLSNFNFDIAGFSLANGAAYDVTPIETATFGATTTFTGVGIDGQNITVTSSEAIGVSTTTDTFTVSTPTNFITDASLSGNTINGLQFDLGDVNTGGAVSVVLPISTYTATGSAIDGTSNTVAIGTNTMLATGGMSYGFAEGVNTGSAATAINAYTVHSFTYSITYTTVPSLVPEPSTWAMIALGAIAGIVVARRRGIA